MDLSLAPRTAPDGRIVVDELPRRFGILPGEVDLVAQFMMCSVDALFGLEEVGSEVEQTDHEETR